MVRGIIFPGTVRAEIITELILERAAPAIFKTFDTGIKSFETDSRTFAGKRASLKITGEIINA